MADEGDGGTNSQKIGKGTGRLGNKRTSNEKPSAETGVKNWKE